MRMLSLPRRLLRCLSATALLLGCLVLHAQDQPQAPTQPQGQAQGQVPTLDQGQAQPLLKPDHPQRYVVKKGDTLWWIANRFLYDPWRWPQIWKANPHIKNPHLIYPGDLLVVTSNNTIKTVRAKPAAPAAAPAATPQPEASQKPSVRQARPSQPGTRRLQPTVRREELQRPIPTIPPNVIQPFLNSPLVVQPGQIERAGHVLIGVDDKLILGRNDQFYARNLATPYVREYHLLRIGIPLRHPESDEMLGIEVIHLGEAQMLQVDGDIAKLLITSSNQEIGPGDRLLSADDAPPLPYYHPHAPSTPIRGWILRSPKGLHQVGRFDIVIISAGAREGIEEGHVLRTLYSRPPPRDPVDGEQYELPTEQSGLLMVFRVFEKLSYALVMQTRDAINIGDRFESPYLDNH